MGLRPVYRTVAMHPRHVRVAVIVAVVALLANGSKHAVRAQSVAFFEHVDFVGGSFDTTNDLSFVGWDWNDQVSSIAVPAGVTVTLYEHADFGGQSLMLTGDNPDLRW